MLFGLELLAGTSFRDLNVDDVVRAAKLAKGTFYIHFSSKDAFLVEMARRYVAFEISAVPELETAGSGYPRVRNWLAWYEGIFARNVGVLRCLVQAAEGSEEMRSLWHRRNDALIDDLMQRFFPVPDGADPTLPRLVLRISGGMVDQSLFERYQVQVGPGRREPEDDALRLELHSLLSYRAIFGADPPAHELTATHQLLGWPNPR